MKFNINGTIVQNLNSKTFYNKNYQNDKNILSLFLKANIHLINTLSNLLTFYSNAKNASFSKVSKKSYKFKLKNCCIKFDLNKFGIMKCNNNSTIAQNFNSRHFSIKTIKMVKGFYYYFWNPKII